MRFFVIFRILYYCDDNGIMILMEDGELPKVEIIDDNIDGACLSKLNDLLVRDQGYFWRNKIYSELSSRDGIISLTYNIFISDKKIAKKNLIRYNKSSIEINRLVNNRGL